MLKFIFSEDFLVSAILFAIPIIFASMAALISNKAGILNINIEGSMAVAALVGALTSHYTGSWVLGLLFAVLAGVTMSLILSFASVKLKTDSILTGIVLNTFASGLCVFILFTVLKVKGDSALAPSVTVPFLKIPLLDKIPVIGKALFDQNILAYAAFLGVLAVWFILKKTRLGLRIIAVGKNPVAAQSVGINVNRIKMYSLIICGVFAGLGGAFLSMVYLSYFSAGMVAGRGFIGIAAEAMGAGAPLLTMLFAVLFGAFDYFSVGAQSVLKVPYELLNTLPYLMTVAALIIYSIKTRKKNV
jgi:simple sugar transport system permease protein